MMTNNPFSEAGRHEDVPLITDASESQEVQFRRRRRQYLVMMSARIVCLVVAAVVVGAQVPYALVWAGVCIAGMVSLPWIAVLVANDRPPRKRTERQALWREAQAGHELPTGSEASGQSAEGRKSTVLDADTPDNPKDR